MTRLFRLIVGVLTAPALVLLVTSPAPAETPSQKADALLSGLIAANDPGVAVLVAQDGKILFEKGYGMADLERHVPITPQTIFRIGSITKQFTASAILKLQEEGKLSVNDQLSKYIPDFPRGGEVSLHQLLNHTSGIHDYSPTQGDFAKPTTTQAVIEALKKSTYDFDPGIKWSYDNTGYWLLGYIVEQVSGRSYETFLRENFFQPLGMANTGVELARPGLPQEALGYTLGANGFERPYYIDPSWNGGDGALYSTAEDLYRWNEAIFNGHVLDAASLKAAFTAVATKTSQLNSGNGYGFGWYIGPYRGLRDISHGGAVPGFSSLLLRLPGEKFTAVILANVLDGKPNVVPSQLAYQIVDIYLADKLAPVRTSK